MVKNNWYTQYLSNRFYDKCMYDVNKAQYICILLCCNVDDYLIFTSGYEHNLLRRVRYKFDKRIDKYNWLTVVEYPSRMEWLLAARSVVSYINMDDFSRPYYLTGKFESDERFYRLFNMWEDTLLHFNRYVMMYESIHGKKEIWNNL